MTWDEMISALIKKGGNEHYSKRYINFIKRCKDKNENMEYEYTENHHILPKAKGYWPEYRLRSEHPWNTVTLTAEQHFIAHWILARALGGRMWFAFNMMFVSSTNGNRAEFTNKKERKIYSDLRQNMKHELRIKSLGRKLTEEQKAKLKAATTGRKRSKEELEKLSKSLRETKKKLYQHKTFIKMYQREYRIFVPKYDEGIQFQRLAEGWQFKSTPEYRTKVSVESNMNRAEYKTRIKRVYYGQFYCLCKEGTEDFEYLISIGGQLKMTPEYAERIAKEQGMKKKGKKIKRGEGLGAGEYRIVWNRNSEKKHIPIGDPLPEGYTNACPDGTKRYWFVNTETKRIDYLTEYEAEIGGYIKTNNPNHGRVKYEHDSGKNLYINVNHWPFEWLPVNIRKL